MVREFRWVTYLGLGLVGSAAIVFFNSILPHCRIFPYSDEWNYLQPLASASRSDFVAWLFAQHVDHRIPLQKVLQTVVLKLSGFDFRALVGVNFLVACVVAVLLMSTARKYRGRASFGDLLIPVCALSLGAGFSLWGFEFQFLSSTFFVALFLYLVVAHELNNRPFLFDLALLALFGCAWCGLNGMVISSVLTLVFAVYFVWKRLATSTPTRVSVFAILTACAGTNVLLWIFWRPSAASNLHTFSVPASAHFFYGLFNSSLIVYAFQNTEWKFCALALLLTAALWFGCRSIARKSNRPLSDMALLAVLGATIVLMLSLAVGRSNYESWAPGFEMHYGFLTIMMPIASWIIVSSNINRKAEIAAGVLLVALFARAYIVNWQWRFEYVSDSRTENRLVQREIATGGSSQDIARKYMRDFFFIDTPDTRSVVTSGIEILRQRGGRSYR